MCGRAYATYTDEELELRYFNKRRPKFPRFTPNYNIAPTQEVPVILEGEDGERQLALFRWQFVPPWEPEFKTKLSTINAKSETVFQSRLYGSAILRHRCIVPVSGFFEWRKIEGDKRKQPFAIRLKGQALMSLAGVWTRWKPAGAAKDAPARYSFAILTTSANTFMNAIHDRMPVILDQKDEETWLDPLIQDRETIERILKPCPDEVLAAHEISTLVNSPANNSPAVLEPPKAAAELEPELDLGLGAAGPRLKRKAR